MDNRTSRDNDEVVVEKGFVILLVTGVKQSEVVMFLNVTIGGVVSRRHEA